MDGAEERLFTIATAFRSDNIFVSGIIPGFSSNIFSTINIVQIERQRLKDAYFEAIWDKKSMFPTGELAAAARITLFWDSSEKWMIVNDRYNEIGLFVTFNEHELSGNVFQNVGHQLLVDKFSEMLHTNKVVALSELERWKEACEG